MQIILVGGDSTEEENEAYLIDKDINFPALRIGGREGLEELIPPASLIPYLVILKADGTKVSEGGDPKAVNEVAKLIEGNLY